MSQKIDNKVEQIKKHVKNMGLYVNHNGSSLSNSQYLNISDEDSDKILKIRVSDHDLPPTYGNMHGYADFEVGDHFEANGDHLDAVNYIAKQFGKEPPKEIDIIRNANEKRAATKKAKQDAVNALRKKSLIDEANNDLDESYNSEENHFSKSNSGKTWYWKHPQKSWISHSAPAPSDLSFNKDNAYKVIKDYVNNEKYKYLG